MPPKKPIPVKRERTAKEYRAEAIRRLKQRFEKEHEGETFDASGEVTVTPLLKSAEGGIPRILDALRAHDNEDAGDFIELYDSLSGKDRQYLKLEEIAVAAGIGALRLWEVASSAMLLHGQREAQMFIASSMRKVLKATVKAATDQVPIVAGIGEDQVVVGHTNGDVRAMELFGKMSGLVPTPKGATINFQNNVTTEKDDDDAPSASPVWIDSSDRLKIIHEAVGQRRLPSPPASPLQVGGRLDQMQTEIVGILRERDDVL